MSYISLKDASVLFDMPRVRLQKLFWRDKKRGMEGRFLKESGRIRVFASSCINFPQSEMAKKMISESIWYIRNQKEMARVISRGTGKREWCEYMNIRNLKYKNPYHAKKVVEALENYEKVYPLLFTTMELSR